jgi:glutathione-regulated potassium-efflux system ancillary protein KefG
MQVISSGGSREVYSEGGHNRFSLNTFLTPFNQTVHLCKAHYLPPFAVQGTHRMEQSNLTLFANAYVDLLKRLQQHIPIMELQSYPLINDWLTATSTQES